MKNVKAYIRTTLTAGLILAAAVLGGCSKSDAGSSAADTAAASSGTESAASADASDMRGRVASCFWKKNTAYIWILSFVYSNSYHWRIFSFRICGLPGSRTYTDIFVRS